MGDQLSMFDTPAAAPVAPPACPHGRGFNCAQCWPKAPKAVEVALESVDRQKVSGKKVEALKGTVIRLLARNADDWFPHGVLVGRDSNDWILNHYRGGYLGQIRCPRAEYLGLEEVDVHPDAYAKHGLR